jgi:enamine deaminase RidA (YjgF/YER057c/UK114 family)
MIKRLQSGPRMSQAVIHGNTVYLAGQVAADPTKDVPGQRETLDVSRTAGGGPIGRGPGRTE